jgi:SAM-dependent methyltransferase/uncharacterized protein YbaR (Trm112 family)
VSARSPTVAARSPPRWLTAVLACPVCLGPLAPAPDLLRCRRCGPYPVLGGVPLLVPEPARYCAAYHDALLAALAEHGLVGRHTLSVVEAFAQASGRPAEPLRFGDDWTQAEVQGRGPVALTHGPAAAPLESLWALGEAQGPRAWLLRQRLPEGLTVEVGCGAGALSEVLARRPGRLVVCDLSLRAVLVARARTAGVAASLVAEAEALPLRRGVAQVVVAENLVDLLEAPLRFLSRVRDVLAAGGRLLLSTPAPELGAGDPASLTAVARRSGLEVLASDDGLPWLRQNAPRHLEVYLAQALLLRRRRGRPVAGLERGVTGSGRR